MWFCGDGTCNGIGGLSFCTNGFLKEDVEFLIERLNLDLNLIALMGKVPHREEEYTVQINKRDEAFKLMNIIKEYVPQCCEYKLRHVRPTIKNQRNIL